MNTPHAYRPSSVASLETRDVPSTFVFHPTVQVPRNAVVVQPINTSIPAPRTNAASTSALAKAGPVLADVYQMMTSQGASVEKIVAKYPFLHINGDKISVSVRATSPAVLNSLVTTLKNVGTDIEAINSAYATVSGYIPISQLMTVANSPQTLSMQANAQMTFRFAAMRR